MPRNLRSPIAAAAALTVLVLAPAASAQRHRDGDHEAARAAMARGEILPLTRILAVVAQETPGNVLEVELDRHDGLIIYEIKILTPAGKVIERHVDARTGALLPEEDDRDARSRRRR